MAGLPRFCTPYQSPPLPTAGGKSEFPHTYTNTPPHARPHAYTYLHKLTQTHILLLDYFIIIPSHFFWSSPYFFFSFPASSPSLFCFAPDKPLFHIVAVGAEGQPLFTSTSQLIWALYQPEGKDMWAEALHSSALQLSGEKMQQAVSKQICVSPGSETCHSWWGEKLYGCWVSVSSSHSLFSLTLITRCILFLAFPQRRTTALSERS